MIEEFKNKSIHLIDNRTGWTSKVDLESFCKWILKCFKESEKEKEVTNDKGGKDEK